MRSQSAASIFLLCLCVHFVDGKNVLVIYPLAFVKDNALLDVLCEALIERNHTVTRIRINDVARVSFERSPRDTFIEISHHSKSQVTQTLNNVNYTFNKQHDLHSNPFITNHLGEAKDSL